MIVNINSTGRQISLAKGKHTIDLVGGWSVKLNGFSITLKNIKTKETIESTTSYWPVQSFYNGIKCKRILNIQIEENGLYEIVFTNADKLIVRRSSLFMHRLFADPVSNENLEILIEE